MQKIILALDPGTKYIGVALSNPEKTIALPKAVIPASKKNLEKYINNILKEYKIEKVIVGKPLSFSNKPIAMTKNAQELADWIKKIFNVPVSLIDERLSTKQVQTDTKNKRVDARAAALILQTYLEAQESRQR